VLVWLPVQCGCVDVKLVKCREILRRVCVNVMGMFRVKVRQRIRDRISVRLVLWSVSTAAFYTFDIRIRTFSLVEQNSFLTNPEKIRYKGLRCVLDSLDDRDYCAKMTPCSTLGNLRY